MKKRIIGIDVARAFAVIGMIIVNFRIVFGEQGEGWLKGVAQLFDGKAAATFVVLAGIGLALMSNSAIAKQDQQKLQRARKRIGKRAFFLFVIGLSYIWIWPADILHFYGIYMLLTLFFLNRKPQQILWGVAVLILLFPLLIAFFDYESGWDFSTFAYPDFWTARGFLRNLFFNGFHPVIPWTAFMLFGLWYGKQDMNDDRFVKRAFWLGAGAFIFIQILSQSLLPFLSQGDPAALASLSQVLGTTPMPPMPLYMLNGLAISTAVISGCILLGRRYESSLLISALNKTGQLALTFYVAHVILGMGLVEELGGKKLGEYSITFSVSYAVLFSLLCVLFAVIWLKYKKSGPLEWIMRKLTN